MTISRSTTTQHTVLTVVIAVALGASTLTSCSSSDSTGAAGSSGTSDSAHASGATDAGGATSTRAAADDGLPTQAELDAATKDVSKLTTKQLAGQVIVGYYEGRTPADAARAMRENGLGGVILMGDNVPADPASPSTGVPAVAAAVQQSMKDSGRSWPAIVGTDQEGGPVTRITSGVMPLPGAMAFGAANDSALATKVAQAEGQELRALGVTMNFAPDADVTIGPSDPTIGVRSPSSDPQRVASAVTAQVSGYQRAGVIPVIKHFPGHGSVTTDTHVNYAVQTQSLNALTKRDWVPFSSAVKAGAPAVMTAHIVLKDVDPNVPGTLSPQVLTGQLREKLGFKGLIVTDGMNMGAIVKTFDQGGRAAVSALKAGADVVLMPADAAKAIAAIEKAVGSGELTRQRLIESAARIVATTRHQQVKTPALSTVGTHAAVANELARKSITQLGGRCGTSMVSGGVRLTGASAHPAKMQRQLATLREELARRGVKESATGVHVHVVGEGVYNAGESSAAGGAEAKSAGGGNAGAQDADVVVSLDTPYVLGARRAGSIGLAAYGSTTPTLSALADVLTGKAKAEGTLPVAVTGAPLGSSACS